MIYPPKKVYVKKSPIHGWGVFASEKIFKDELIEESTILSLPIEKGESSSLFLDYRFNFPCGPDWIEQVLAMGFGGIYNHSDDSNAYWISDYEKRTFRFIAKRDIEIGEEVFTYYGDVNYWTDGRDNIEVK
jgi:uncharacterized protein